MFRRSSRSNVPAEPTIGVGAIVTVGTGAGGAASGWEGEPTGVVISPGDNEMAGYPGLAPGGPLSWYIAFDEPAYKVGNPAPFDEATVAARFLTLVPIEGSTAD
ncbi:hypothetical protein [Subtercola sp. YIM 133946]|uniref:hypothetical protein n=1 Tax=Subtercola sp. YIM 133946 TaxID=3118909 RepID=UPI002F953856